MCNYFQLPFQCDSKTRVANALIFFMIAEMVFFLDQMHPVGFDIIGLKISLSEALRLVRLVWRGEMMAKAFCLCSAVPQPGPSVLNHRSRPCACWVLTQKGAHYMESGVRNKNMR